MSEELTQLSIPNLPVGIKESLEREATKQDRSLASLLRNILVEYVNRIPTEAPTKPRKQAAS